MPNTNPYPGPVPLSDGHFLKGRERDINRFLDNTMNRKVIEVHGRSGVGKSSLLNAGITPRLQRNGFTVATVSAWEQVSSWDRIPAEQAEDDRDVLASPQRLWASAVDRALEDTAPLYVPVSTDLDDYVRELSTIGGLVIVFDQLEELFRSDEAHGRTLGQRFLEYVAAVAKDDRFRLVQVLSLRSEHLSELIVPIEQNMAPSMWTVVEVGPVNFAKTVPEIINVAPVRDSGFTPEVHKLWNVAAYGTAESQPDAVPSIGLLELQALLWSVADSADLSPGQPLTLKHIEAVASAHAPSSSGPDATGEIAADSFTDAMESYIQRSLEAKAIEYTKQHSASAGLDNTGKDVAAQRAQETINAAGRIATHLSSAGYKLVRDTEELARIAIPPTRDLHLMRTPAPLAQDQVPQSVLDVLAEAEVLPDSAGERTRRHLPDHEASIEEIARLCRVGKLADDITTLVAATRVLWQTHARRSDRLSGRMVGSDPAVAIVEMVANYERALQWLENSFIVRLTPTATGHRTVALVHDGFGVPLARWGQAQNAKPEAAVASLIAMSGELVLESPLDVPLTSKQLLGETVKDVRWIGCEMRAGFRDVTFERCDFRGSVFMMSRFENVVFKDCTLWGALFLGGTLSGVRFSGGAPLQTLTMRECTIKGDGIVLENLPERSYGLFIDEATGGPWTIQSCPDLSHVALSGNDPDNTKDKDPDNPKDNLGAGTIVDSTVAHLTIGKGVDPGTTVTNSSLLHVDGRGLLGEATSGSKIMECPEPT